MTQQGILPKFLCVVIVMDWLVDFRKAARCSLNEHLTYPLLVMQTVRPVLGKIYNGTFI